MANDREGKGGLAGSAISLLTREVTRLPLVALTLGLKAWEQGRPVRELILRRGDELLQIAAHTPLGRFLPQPTIDDGADVEAEQIAADARIANVAFAAAAVAREEAQEAEAQEAEAEEAIDVPASGHDLPIADFDGVSIGSLRARLRSLSVEDLVVLREWEKSHANRPAVVTLLDNRIAKVSAS